MILSQIAETFFWLIVGFVAIGVFALFADKIQKRFNAWWQKVEKGLRHLFDEH